MNLIIIVREELRSSRRVLIPVPEFYAAVKAAAWVSVQDKLLK